MSQYVSFVAVAEPPSLSSLCANFDLYRSSLARLESRYCARSRGMSGIYAKVALGLPLPWNLASLQLGHSVAFSYGPVYATHDLRQQSYFTDLTPETFARYFLMVNRECGARYSTVKSWNALSGI